MKRVILIGGAGLIGSSILQYLENDSNSDFEVILFEKKKTSKKKNNYVVCDISNQTSFRSNLKSIHKINGKIDAIINCSFPKIDKKKYKSFKNKF